MWGDGPLGGGGVVKGYRSCSGLFREGKGVGLGELKMLTEVESERGRREGMKFCDRREELLEAMSLGGRGPFGVVISYFVGACC
jgi:hypothetical protein